MKKIIQVLFLLCIKICAMESDESVVTMTPKCKLKRLNKEYIEVPSTMSFINMVEALYLKAEDLIVVDRQYYAFEKFKSCDAMIKGLKRAQESAHHKHYFI